MLAYCFPLLSRSVQPKDSQLLIGRYVYLSVRDHRHHVGISALPGSYRLVVQERQRVAARRRFGFEGVEPNLLCCVRARNGPDDSVLLAIGGNAGHEPRVEPPVPMSIEGRGYAFVDKRHGLGGVDLPDMRVRPTAADDIGSIRVKV